MAPNIGEKWPITILFFIRNPVVASNLKSSLKSGKQSAVIKFYGVKGCKSGPIGVFAQSGTPDGVTKTM